MWRKLFLNGLICLIFALFIFTAKTALAQTDNSSGQPPDAPVSEVDLVDPSSEDVASDIFSDDFSTTAGTTAVSNSSASTSASSSSDSSTPSLNTTNTTTQSTDTVATTTVADAPTGPGQTAMFWAIFVSIFLILQTARNMLKGENIL